MKERDWLIITPSVKTHKNEYEYCNTHTHTYIYTENST